MFRPLPQDRSSIFLGMPAIIVSKPMRRLMEIVERVAPSAATVLVTGESGSGKEVVARALHHYSERCSKSWVDLSCAALPEHLLESELFGYDKGAFTGADSAKMGLFELANQGSIFLDEIGELDLKMQVKLLRVLDGVPYYRLGGVRKIAVDVRVIAATNQDLEAAVAQGRFRRDLYYRLTQVILAVPPLRERLEDIVPLAEYFLTKEGKDLRFSEAALDALHMHPWSGNIRELRNIVTRAAVLAQTQVIEPEDLLLKRHPPDDASTGSLDAMERRMIMDALEAADGHQQKAAVRLGISRRTLSRKLKLYKHAGAGN